jgi:hypothetical protein
MNEDEQRQAQAEGGKRDQEMDVSEDGARFLDRCHAVNESLPA